MRKAFRWAVVMATLAVGALALAACTVNVPVGDFNITVGVKTAANPLFGVGVDVAYFVNGVEAKTLTLTSGQKYTFGINAPGHPFYLSTNKDGGTGFPGEVTTGVVGSRTENGLLTFTSDATTPSTLYYNCGVHLDMGGTITITP